MLEDAALDAELIAGVYEAAAEPARWPDLWTVLCAVFEAGSGLLFRQSHIPDGPGRAVVDWPPLPLRAFDDGLVHLDPFAAAGELGEVFGALMGREVAVARDFAAGPNYAAFARRYLVGAHHVIACTLPLEGFASAGIALHRAEAAGPFTPGDARALAALARHLAAALRLERVLAEARIAKAARDSVLDHLPYGAVIAAADGRVVFANKAAWKIAEGGGIEIASLAGIRPTAPAHAETFARMLRQAARGRPGGSLRLLRNRGAAIALCIEPLQGPLAAQGAGLALVLLRNLAASVEISAPQLMALFDLTAAEVSIMPQLLAGDPANLIAQSRGVKVATVRDQSARILAKTGAPNLRALATMIAALG